MRSALFTMVGLALCLPLTGAHGQCVGDADGDGTVRVNELVTAVNNSLSGCDEQDVTLQFAAKVGDLPFACGEQYTGLGTRGSTFIPADMRFFISAIRLINAEGQEVPLQLEQDGKWQAEDLALLDFEDKTPPCSLGTTDMNSIVRGHLPHGTYRGVRFVLGIPFKLNHQDQTLPSTPPALKDSWSFWNWQGGHKFIRIDEATDLFRVHLGSTQCVSRVPTQPPAMVCGRPNLGEIILPDFDPNTQTIVADLAALLADSDIEGNQEDTAPGCASDFDDTDCVPIFRNLGINFDNGLPDPSRQKFFRVE